jgi:branched-chain amino acid transport system substrate-binding protein
MPLSGPTGGDGLEVVRGARLALADAHGKAGDLAVRAIYLDDTTGQGGGASWSPARAAANARTATEDSTAIAYLGEFESGATRSSLPITNQAHLLQVSPASTAIDLVSPSLGSNDVPEEVQPSGQRSFGRVIPADDAQAAAGADWVHLLGVRRVGVESDGSEFGRTMAAGFEDALRGASVTRRGERLVYYAGDPERAPRSVQSLPGSVAIMESDALLQCPSCGGDLGRPILATSAAQDPSQLTASGEEFVREYQRRYGSRPGRYAPYGYEAMAVVLDSIRRAGDSGTDREAVTDAFFATADRESVLGTYSIDELGDTTLDRMAGYRLGPGGTIRFATALGAR